jgi:RNA polymerase sigma factor (sigma-70 family)
VAALWRALLLAGIGDFGRPEPYHRPVRLKSVLASAARRDEAAVLALSRRVTQLLDRYGAYSVRRDWSVTTRDIVAEIGERWRQSSERADPEQQLESVVKNRFWGEILELVSRDDARAAGLLFPTIRRLLATWDRARVQEAAWDDIVQETARQIWERWREGDVERPWALLCTIARRRFLDRLRAQRPDTELPDEQTLGETAGVVERSEHFTAQALETLSPRERDIVVMMDLEGHTRVEIAGKLGMTEGEVLSIRRAGLRRLWRWLGRDLPPALREVWEEMFKGARRASPADVASKLSLSPDDVTGRLQEARHLLGLEGGVG